MDCMLLALPGIRLVPFDHIEVPADHTSGTLLFQTAPEFQVKQKSVKRAVQCV